ncbi:unnamed protein product, partial [Meganyctiphanes norvegica]
LRSLTRSGTLPFPTPRRNSSSTSNDCFCIFNIRYTFAHSMRSVEPQSLSNTPSVSTPFNFKNFNTYTCVFNNLVNLEYLSNGIIGTMGSFSPSSVWAQTKALLWELRQPNSAEGHEISSSLLSQSGPCNQKDKSFLKLTRLVPLVNISPGLHRVGTYLK